MDDVTLSQSELAEEVSSSDENLQTGGDVPSDDDQGPSTSLACALPHLSICSGDFGKVVKLKSTGHRLTDDEKYSLLRHCFVPSPSYSLPPRKISGRQRPFQHHWLGKYSGLCYSVSDNGATANTVSFLPNALLQWHDWGCLLRGHSPISRRLVRSWVTISMAQVKVHFQRGGSRTRQQ